jgi:hypothetical protein
MLSYWRGGEVVPLEPLLPPVFPLFGLVVPLLVVCVPMVLPVGRCVPSRFGLLLVGFGRCVGPGLRTGVLVVVTPPVVVPVVTSTGSLLTGFTGPVVGPDWASGGRLVYLRMPLCWG